MFDTRNILIWITCVTFLHIVIGLFAVFLNCTVFCPTSSYLTLENFDKKVSIAWVIYCIRYLKRRKKRQRERKFCCLRTNKKNKSISRILSDVHISYPRRKTFYNGHNLYRLNHQNMYSCGFLRKREIYVNDRNYIMITYESWLFHNPIVS